MNAKETEHVLGMIAAHYWQRVRKTPEEQTLMVGTWTEVFAGVPLDPHVKVGLAAWFEDHEWPPQASELRRLAMDLGGPTPKMLAEAEAWNRESAYRAEMRKGMTVHEAWEREAELEEDVRRFRAEVRAELGLAPLALKRLKVM